MAVEIDEPALTAYIKHVVGTLDGRLSTKYALGAPVADLVGDVRALAALWAELETMIGERWQEPRGPEPWCR
ncbi:hypothetical protein ACQBAR_05090 [Propionibacteriaceae bacterium Y1685]